MSTHTLLMCVAPTHMSVLLLHKCNESTINGNSTSLLFTCTVLISGT